jgi:hypothetical protein
MSETFWTKKEAVNLVEVVPVLDKIVVALLVKAAKIVDPESAAIVGITTAVEAPWTVHSK